MANNNSGEIKTYAPIRVMTEEGKAAFAEQVFDETQGRFQSAINQDVKEELDKINGKFSKESTQSEEQALVFTTDGGTEVGKIDPTGADFTNLKRGGQQVARMSDLPTKDTSIGDSPSNTNVPTTKAVKDYVDANAMGDLPISEETAASTDEELVVANDADTDTYAKAGSYGVKAKAYLDMSGNSVIPTKDTSIGSTPSQTNVPTSKAVADYVAEHGGGGGSSHISDETIASEVEEVIFGNNSGSETYASVNPEGVKAKAFKKIDGSNLLPNTINLNSIGVCTAPSPIYSVYNDLGAKQYNNRIYVDHLIYNLSTWNDKIGFDLDTIKDFAFTSDYNNVEPVTNGTSKNVYQVNITKTIVSGDSKKNVTFKHRSVKASVGQNITPRVLCIGDSVTEGAGSDYQKKADTPKQYWSWLKWYFENDRIANNNTGYDLITIGTYASDGSIAGMRDTWSLNGRNYKTFCTAKGGWDVNSLNTGSSGDDLMTPEIEGSGINPFYDPSQQKFSMAYYLENYRTMDQNGNRLYFDAQQTPTGTAGANNRGYLADGTAATDGSGNPLYIGKLVTNTTTYNVCEPTHVVIVMMHNSSSADYQSVMPVVIADIKSVIPDVIIAVGCIDSAGTYAPAVYNNLSYEGAQILTSLHDKNIGSLYPYVQENLEDEENNVFALSLHLVQHPTNTIRGKFAINADTAANEEVIDGVQPTFTWGANKYHPNNVAHRAWGYQLYCFIKYTLTLN